jgi:hypothetical protein
MMSKKVNILWILLSLVFVAVLNFIIFLINTKFTTTFWVSYGFIHFAYLIFVISSSTIPKAKNSLVLGYPLIYLSYLYFVSAFIIGLIFIFFKNAPFSISFIPQLIIAGLYAQAYISNVIFNEKTISKDKESQYNISYIKNAVAELTLLMNQSTDNMFRKKLEKLHDSFRSSQVKSHPVLYGLEESINQYLQILKSSVHMNDYSGADKAIDTISRLLIERNSKISNMR